MRKIKRNSFVEGTIIAYLAIVLTKILGAIYVIPFYAIIGEHGGVIYACAYNIYCLFLALSISGIPNAVSIIVSEFNSLKMYWAKERVRKIATRAIFIVSMLAFILMFSCAGIIGRFFLADEAGADVTLAIRIISFCLLIVPYLSITRGYMQGHAFITPPSVSEVIEQLVRIAVVLAGSFLAIKVLHLSEATGVNVALSGAFFGALIAYLYLVYKEKTNKEAFLPPADAEVDNTRFSTRALLKRIMNICIPIVIVSLATDIYNITDMKLVIVGLNNLGYAAAQSEIVASITATWGPKICMLITALAIGLSSSIVPHIVDSYVKKDIVEVNRKFNQAINTVTVVALPMAVGMIMLAEPIYYVFYGASQYGPLLMLLLPLVSLVSSMNMVASMAMQSIGRAKIVCYATVIGVAINAGLDLPLIYLVDRLGFPAYQGAAVASIIGQLISLGIIMFVLKKQLHFRYWPIIQIFCKSLLICLLMAAAVWGLKFILPLSTESRLLCLLQMLPIAAIGGGLYFIIAWRSNSVKEVLGEDFMAKILGKLKFRKTRIKIKRRNKNKKH